MANQDVPLGTTAHATHDDLPEWLSGPKFERQTSPLEKPNTSNLALGRAFSA